MPLYGMPKVEMTNSPKPMTRMIYLGLPNFLEWKGPPETNTPAHYEYS
jgi:hypothetical protein